LVAETLPVLPDLCRSFREAVAGCFFFFLWVETGNSREATCGPRTRRVGDPAVTARFRRKYRGEADLANWGAGILLWLKDGQSGEIDAGETVVADDLKQPGEFEGGREEAVERGDDSGDDNTVGDVAGCVRLGEPD